MAVSDGQPVNAATTNAAFLDKNQDTTTTYNIQLSSSTASDGASVARLQRFLNAVSSFVGLATSAVYNILPAWATSNRGTSSDTVLARVEAIDTAFDSATGHKHTGAAGDAPQISLAQGVSGTLGTSNGGTGQNFSASTGAVISASGIMSVVAPSTSGNVLTSNGTTWISSTPAGSAANTKQYLSNAAFDVWQRGTSLTVANTISAYGPDRWYVKNSLGTNGVITVSQTTGSIAGSKYGCSVKITTAPTVSPTNGTELYQVIENLDTIELYNQNACFSVSIKALGNVNQVGLQFFYATSEAKLTTSIGTEQLITVNSSTFTSGSITAQALGTAMTTSGVVGVRIRITAVSTGNAYDLNNGFIVEQAIMNLGSSNASFARKERCYGDEIEDCARWFQVIPVGVSFGSFASTVVPGTGNGSAGIPLVTQMRTAPTLSNSTISGLTANWFGGAAAVTASTIDSSSTNLLQISYTFTAGTGRIQPAVVYGNGTSIKLDASI